MPLATKNNALIVKDGKIAENCGCCGGWYCYCVTQPACDLFSQLGLSSTSCLQVALSGFSGGPQQPFDSSFTTFTACKPGTAMNGTLFLRKATQSEIPTAVTGFKFLNNGAGLKDRTDPFVIFTIRQAENAGTGDPLPAINLSIGDVGARGIAPVFATKQYDPCSFSSPSDFSVTFNSSDFVINSAFTGGWQEYDFSNATATVSVANNCPSISDYRSWWFATPYGKGGETNPPPSTLALSVVDSQDSVPYAKFGGQYQVTLGKTIVSGTGTQVVYGTQHGSFYASEWIAYGAPTIWYLGAVIQRYVRIADVVPRLVSANGAPCVVWRVGLIELPAWPNSPPGAYLETQPLPWGSHMSGTVPLSGRWNRSLGGASETLSGTLTF